MSNRIEVEQKFFCKNIQELIKLIKIMNFKELDVVNEIDEYFTDIQSEYIKNRTCLRIRKTNNKQMEMTFKGRSINFTGCYTKTESNINIDISEYNTLKNMLFSLGFYSYCTVDKIRKEYSKLENNIEYNIMIDEIKNIGYFVEFEFFVEEENKKNLENELKNFIGLFNNIEFEEANLPYRDFIAKYHFDVIKNKYDLKTIYYNTKDNLKLKLIEQLKEKKINVLEHMDKNLDNNTLLINDDIDLQILLYLVNWL